jgi:5-methylcytosine-specific restriction endonuclease McrA
MSPLAKLRHRAFHAQAGRCCYCGLPMFLSSPPPGCKGLLATAEHLHPRSEGGKDLAGNIAAACLHCNRTRHRSPTPLSAEDYAKRVQKRLKAGGWHPKAVLQAMKLGSLTRPRSQSETQ